VAPKPPVSPEKQSQEVDMDAAAIRQRAERGDAKAQRSLGDMYRMGDGVPQDMAQALAWYRKAADQGDAFALGEVYENGQGVARDYVQALAWYRKAADLGDASAQSTVGSLYYFGRSPGIPRDYAQALIWFQRGAQQGDPMALVGLGGLYSAGQGVQRDLVEAHKWVSLGASRTRGAAEQAAKGAVRNIEALMTPQQIAEAQKRASEWQAMHDPGPGKATEPKPPVTPSVTASEMTKQERALAAFRSVCGGRQCFSVRQSNTCDVACAEVVAERLRTQLHVSVASTLPLINWSTYKPGCVGYRPGLSGTLEFAELVRGVLGEGYFIGPCTVDGFPITVVARPLRGVKP
jgi:hypothetical protein